MDLWTIWIKANVAARTVCKKITYCQAPIYILTYLYLRYQHHLLWNNELRGLQLKEIIFCLYSGVFLLTESYTVWVWAQWSLWQLTTLFTDLKCQCSVFSPAAFGFHTTLLVLAIMIIICFPLFPFLHPPLSWTSCVWSLNQPKQSGRTEENSLEKREELSRWFCSASCITGELPVHAWCCLNVCEDGLF